MEQLKYVDRRNTNCSKWDNLQAQFGRTDLHAMWVADMDFEVPACVKDALHKYVEQGVIGYYKVPDSYYEAFMNWEEKHHGLKPEREWLRFSPGVVAAFNWVVKCMTEPGDAVIVMTPVYYPFFGAVNNNDRKLVTSDLINENGIYSIDYADFEQKIVDNNVKLFIMCSPHNPVGRVWKKEELKKVLDICRKHRVFVISDEIYSELCYTDQHVSIANIEGMQERTILINGFSKSYAMTGWRLGWAMGPKELMRHICKIHQFGIMSAPTTAQFAGIEAIRTGEDDIERMREQYDLRRRYLLGELRSMGLECFEPQGAFYMFPSIESTGLSSDEFCERLLHEQEVAVIPGSAFGESGEGHVRISYSYSMNHLREACRRMRKFLQTLQAEK